MKTLSSHRSQIMVIVPVLALFFANAPVFAQADWLGRVQGEIKYYGLNASVETWAYYDEMNKPSKIGISISESFVDPRSSNKELYCLSTTHFGLAEGFQLIPVPDK